MYLSTGDVLAENAPQTPCSVAKPPRTWKADGSSPTSSCSPCSSALVAVDRVQRGLVAEARDQVGAGNAARIWTVLFFAASSHRGTRARVNRLAEPRDVVDDRRRRESPLDRLGGSGVCKQLLEPFLGQLRREMPRRAVAGGRSPDHGATRRTATAVLDVGRSEPRRAALAVLVPASCAIDATAGALAELEMARNVLSPCGFYRHQLGVRADSHIVRLGRPCGFAGILWAGQDSNLRATDYEAAENPSRTVQSRPVRPKQPVR